MSTRKIEIEKLSGAEDWNRWKWEIQNSFVMHDVLEFVDSTKECSVVTTVLSLDSGSETLSSEKERERNRIQERLKKKELVVKEWKKQDAFTKGLIMSALHRETTAKLILTCESSKEC